MVFIPQVFTRKIPRRAVCEKGNINKARWLFMVGIMVFYGM
jgi:hypothetical protein